MVHTSPQFLLLDEGAINVEDISTALPYPGPGALVSEGTERGVVVTFMSKGTSVKLPGWTVERFNELLRHA